MKDSYSFDLDLEGLDAAYEKHREAYARIFDRAGLQLVRGRVRRRDDGRHRRARVHGAVPGGRERRRAGARLRRQRRGRERRRAAGRAAGRRSTRPRRSRTPGRDHDRRGRRAALGGPGRRVPEGVPGRHRGQGPRDRARARRPPRQRDQARQRARRARSGRRTRRRSPSGSARPASSARSAPTSRSCSTRPSSRAAAYVVGANREDHHLRGVEPGRDFPFERVDVRRVEAGDTVDGQADPIEPAIEVGNIFKLGTRYSEPLNATVLDESGKARTIVMGSYGIGPARIMAAAVEQYADEQRHLAGRARSRRGTSSSSGSASAGTEERALAERLYGELAGRGLERALRRPRRAGRARSSPTPSCSAARCG